MSSPRSSPLELEVARLRKEVAALEAELGSYGAIDRDALRQGARGTLVAVVVSALLVVVAALLVGAMGGLYRGCQASAPHHGPQPPP